MTLSVTPRPEQQPSPTHPALQAARNLPLITSVAGTHFGRPGAKAASVVLRRCPPPMRGLIDTPAVRHLRPELVALAKAADGQLGEAQSLLRQAVESLDSRSGTGRGGRHAGRTVTQRLRLAHAAVVLHDLPLAHRALSVSEQAKAATAMAPSRGSRHGDVALVITRSLVAAEQGNLDEALDHLDGVAGAAAHKLRQRLTGERQVLRTELMTTSLVDPPAPRPLRSPPRVGAVLHVLSGALPEHQSGYTVRSQGILEGQRASGLDARAVTRLGFPVDTGVFGAASEVEVQGVPYYRLLPSRGVPLPGRARQEMALGEVESLVRRLKPDVLHAHSKHENAQIAVVAGRRLGVPVVYEARGFLEETWVSTGGDPHTDFYRWTREAETRCMQQVEQVITLSTAMAQDIVGRGIAAERVHVVPNAVSSSFAERPDGPAGQHRRRAHERTRRRYGIPLGCTVFGTVSTLNDYEGLDCAIEALALTAPQLRLLVVGDGPARRALEQHAAACGVTARVSFTGRVAHTEVRDHLDGMDVFVVPRRSTSVTRVVPPLKPLEAMAVGVPLLASDLPALAEIVQPGRFGSLVPPEDPTRWAQAMTALADDPSLRTELGSRAARFVREQRTWATLATQYRSIYTAALAG
ncbi:MAG: glycosyltransferase family 4 protein [Ornithinimicrobium sp.]